MAKQSGGRTSKPVASKASAILRSPKSTPTQRSVAASDLGQRAKGVVNTSKAVASKAARILSDPKSSKAAKSVAASDLGQRVAPKKGKK